MEYAAQRVYLIGRGSSRVFARIHHINLGEDQKRPQDKKAPMDLVPPALWVKRLDLFSRYDEGIKIDLTSWTEIVPERIAKMIAKRCKSEKVFDAFCGTGSNAIQFAKYSEVIALDLDPMKVEYAKHNALLYDVVKKVNFLQGDFMALGNQIKADVIFIDPPQNRNSAAEESFDVFNTFANPSIVDILSVAQHSAKSILLYLPKQVELSQIAFLVKEHTHFDCAIELDVFHLRGEVQGVCLSMGAAVSLPHKDVVRLVASRLSVSEPQKLILLENIVEVAGLRKIVDLLGRVDALTSTVSTRVNEDTGNVSKASEFFAMVKDDPDIVWDDLVRKLSEEDEPLPEAPQESSQDRSQIIRLHSVEGGDDLTDAIRMLLAYKNLRFIDHKIVLGKYDPSRLAELSEFGVFPALDYGGKRLLLVRPILRYLSQLHGLYPIDIVQIYQVESLCDYVIDAHKSTLEAKDRNSVVESALLLIGKRLNSMATAKVFLHELYVLWFLWRWRNEVTTQLPPVVKLLKDRLTAGNLGEYFR